MPPASPSASSPLPAQPFFASPSQRVGLARERFFGHGQRPTGLVSEAVIQSWARCWGARRGPQEAVAFEPVTRSRLHATLNRNRALLQAASAELLRLEQALAGTGCRVLLTDAEGVIVHVTAGPAASDEPVLKRVSRVGVNLNEGLTGTNAPALVLKTGAPVTVIGAEHYFDCIRTLSCAAAPIHDGRGALAGVLDLTVEARPFGFDAAALVGVYATAIENRLLQAAAREHLVLQFQVCPTLLDTPLQALVGLDSQGQVAWLNGTAEQLLGGGQPGTAGATADTALGVPLAELLRRSTQAQAGPLRLPNGLGVWLRARLQAADGATAPVAMGRTPGDDSPPLTAPPATGTVDAHASAWAEAPPPLADAARQTAAATAPTAGLDSPATLDQHAREVIERALQQHGGNISGAARALGVSRGLLYRRLREWRAAQVAAPTGA